MARFAVSVTLYLRTAYLDNHVALKYTMPGVRNCGPSECLAVLCQVLSRPLPGSSHSTVPLYVRPALVY